MADLPCPLYGTTACLVQLVFVIVLLIFVIEPHGGVTEVMPAGGGSGSTGLDLDLELQLEPGFGSHRTAKLAGGNWPSLKQGTEGMLVLVL